MRLLTIILALSAAFVGGSGTTANAAPARPPSFQVRFQWGHGFQFGWSHARHYRSRDHGTRSHRHSYHTTTRRVWVEPRYVDQVVGYNSCGEPIVRHILSHAGYWTVVREQACRCGYRRR